MIEIEIGKFNLCGNESLRANIEKFCSNEKCVCERFKGNGVIGSGRVDRRVKPERKWV